MIIVDTSVWIDHINQHNPVLDHLLREDRILQHAMVTAEIALGSLKNRAKVVGLLNDLPQASAMSHSNLLQFIASNEIHGTGLGFVDVHLLAAGIFHKRRVWTRDKRLNAQAERLGCAFNPD